MKQTGIDESAQESYNLNYNSCTNGYGTASLCDIARRQFAKSLLPLYATINGYNLNEKRDQLNKLLEPCTEDLKPFIAQHLFYLCHSQGWKVEYRKKPSPLAESHTKFAVISLFSALTPLLCIAAPYHPSVGISSFTTVGHIFETKFSPKQNYLAVACKNSVMQIFQNKSDVWSEHSSISFKTDPDSSLKTINFLDENICLFSSGKYLTIISTTLQQSSIEYTFDKPIRTVLILDTHNFIVTTEDEYFFCNNDNKFDITSISKIDTAKANLKPSLDAKTIAVLNHANNTITIHVYNNEKKWQIVKTIELSNIDKNFQKIEQPAYNLYNKKLESLEDSIVQFTHAKPSKKFPGQGILKTKIYYYSLALNQTIGTFKQKCEQGIPYENELSPTLPCILASIAFAHSKTDKKALEDLKDCSLLQLLPLHTTAQLVEKINKKIEAINKLNS